MTLRQNTIVRCDACRRPSAWEGRGLFDRLLGRCPFCKRPIKPQRDNTIRNPIAILYTPGSGTSYYLSRLHGEAMLGQDYRVETADDDHFERLTRLIASNDKVPSWHSDEHTVWPKDTYRSFKLVHGASRYELVAGKVEAVQPADHSAEWVLFLRHCPCVMVTIHASALRRSEEPGEARAVLEFDRLHAEFVRHAFAQAHSISRIAVVLTAIDLLGDHPEQCADRANALFQRAFPTLRRVLANTGLAARVIPTTSYGFGSAGNADAELRFPAFGRPFNIVAPFDFLLGEKHSRYCYPLTGTESAARCFISYSRSDEASAVRLKSELEAQGLQTWRDVDNIPSGASWDGEIEAAITACSHFLLVVTPTSMESQNVKDEIGFARERKKPILPLIFKDAQLPMRVHRAQAIDFSRDYATALAKLLSALM